MKPQLIKRKIKDAMFGNTQNTAIGVQEQEMADARKGVIYFLGNTKMEKVPADISLDLVGTFVGNASALSEIKTGCQYLLNNTDQGVKLAMKGQKLKDAIKSTSAVHKAEELVAAAKATKVATNVKAAAEKGSELIAKIKAKIAKYFRHMMERIRISYGDKLFGVEWVAEFGLWAATSFTDSLADLIPGWGYVQAAADIVAGVGTAIKKSMDLHQVYWSGRGVALQGGHPCAIASALKRHAAGGVASGIKDGLLGVSSMVITGLGDAASGAGTIITAVTGVLSRITALVDYMIQRIRVTKILKVANDAWLKKDSPNSLVNDHKRFAEWFQDSVITTPIIAALALRSGFAAHPYKFLQLLQPNQALIGSREYAKGVRHIQKLTKYSSKYLTEYNDAYNVRFSSKDDIVTARLHEAQGGNGVLHEYAFARPAHWGAAATTP